MSNPRISISKTLIASACAPFVLSACTSTAAPPAPSVGLANPASLHCVERGGTLKIIKGSDGKRGMCHLPDGMVVEEWELLRRDRGK